MAEIPYTVVKRKNSLSAEKTDIYYPSLVNNGKVKTKELKNRVATQTTISEDEAKRFVEAVAMIIVNDLKAGFQVKFSKLGILSPAITTKTVATADEVDASTIKRKYIHFRPSVELTAELKNATFAKADLDIKHV